MRTAETTEDTSMAAEAEQAADLAALQAAAAGAEPAPGAVAAAEGEAQALQPPSAAAMQMAAMVVGMARPIVCFAVPSLRDAPGELWQPVPEGIACVMDHYGASAEWMQSPWARLGMSLMPLVAFAAVQAMKEPPKKDEGEPLKLAATAPDVVAGQKTVTFGAPVTEAAA